MAWLAPRPGNREPETVIGWHRKGFRLFWTRKSRRRKPGRPPVSREIRYLVRRMFAGEHTVGRTSDPWRAFEAWLFHLPGRRLEIHGPLPIAAIAVVADIPYKSRRLPGVDRLLRGPTATFHLLSGFIVLHHERRQIVHFGVTANPTMAWVAQQIREAFPWGTAPRYLIRDRDGAYGQTFRSTVTAMGVEEVVTAPRSPWQKSVCGTPDRQREARIPGPFDHPQRAAFAAHSWLIPRLLSRFKDPLVARQGHTGWTTPFSRPGPERSFPCPRSAVCIIVTNASRPDHPRSDSINSSLWQRGRCRHPHALHRFAARSGGISIVMTAPVVDYKIHWLKMMSVPESRAVVGRHDGINGRDRSSASCLCRWCG